jgi:hypothetical protein
MQDIKSGVIITGVMVVRKFLRGSGKIPNAAGTAMMVIITDKIDVKMSGRSQHRAERTT